MNLHRELFTLREAYASVMGVWGYWERGSLLPGGIRKIQEYSITKGKTCFFSLQATFL